jgi:hypothetical protein
VGNEFEEVRVMIANSSFWRKCSELRSSEIGQWLIGHGYATWPCGRPPRFEVRQFGERRFRVECCPPDHPAAEDHRYDRREFGLTRSLFCTLSGSTSSIGYVRIVLTRLARKAGIEKRVHAHGLATGTPTSRF